jgi:hypothetical protein
MVATMAVATMAVATMAVAMAVAARVAAARAAAPHQCRRTAAAAAPQKYSRLQEQQVVERINEDQHRVPVGCVVHQGHDTHSAVARHLVALCIRVTTHTLQMVVKVTVEAAKAEAMADAVKAAVMVVVMAVEKAVGMAMATGLQRGWRRW